MSNKRTEIREAIKNRITAAVAYSVFAARKLDGRGKREFANVYISDGDATYEGVFLRHESNLVVAYANSDEVDDAFIDLRGDEIQAAIVAESFGDVMDGIFYTGFEYLDESERGFSGIELRFTVLY